MAGNQANVKVEKRPLYDMFTAVPPRYDRVNRLVTWGLDRRWRRKAALECLASRPARVLDLGCGTGDLAVNLAHLANGNAEIAGLDYSQPMLERASQKAARLSGARPFFVRGDAARLPFPDDCFDCVAISFAFRNLTYKNPHSHHHIAEVRRVLRPGGRFVIVESSQPKSRLIRRLFHIYLRSFVYQVGSLVSGNRGAYRYLAESAARFYTPGELQNLLLGAGFERVAYRPLFFGAAGIHVAVK